jgi:hypothetical protein
MPKNKKVPIVSVSLKEVPYSLRTYDKTWAFARNKGKYYAWLNENVGKTNSPGFLNNRAHSVDEVMWICRVRPLKNPKGYTTDVLSITWRFRNGHDKARFIINFGTELKKKTF